jgi:hypothetical protein
MFPGCLFPDFFLAFPIFSLKFRLVSNLGRPFHDVDLSRPGEALLRSLEGPPSGADVISPTNKALFRGLNWGGTPPIVII